MLGTWNFFTISTVLLFCLLIIFEWLQLNYIFYIASSLYIIVTFLNLFRNSKYLSKNLSRTKSFRQRYSFIVQNLEYFLVVIALFNLIHSFLLLRSRNVFEFIYRFQIVFETHAIFRVWIYIVIRMGREYLSTFKN